MGPFLTFIIDCWVVYHLHSWDDSCFIRVKDFFRSLRCVQTPLNLWIMKMFRKTINNVGMILVRPEKCKFHEVFFFFKGDYSADVLNCILSKIQVYIFHPGSLLASSLVLRPQHDVSFFQFFGRHWGGMGGKVYGLWVLLEMVNGIK